VSPYQRVLDIAREQAAAVGRGELEAATGMLDRRADVIVAVGPPTAEDTLVIEEILRLDRDLATAIRKRMIEIRNEALEGQHGRSALNGYGRRVPGRPIAVDRHS
jgi:hypothetical protein